VIFSVVDDVKEVSRIVTIFSLSVVLSHPLMSITFSQASVTTNRRCFIASGARRPIAKLVANGGESCLEWGE
jgi:hypothetical protein